MTPNDYRDRANRFESVATLAEMSLVRATAATDAAIAHQQAVEQGQHAVQVCAAELQQQATSTIAAVVTKALQATFGPDTYQLAIDWTKARGKTTAVVTLQDGDYNLDPVTATGGGVVDVVAMSLRVAALLLDHRAAKVLVLDEPFKFLSAAYLPAAATMLQAMADDLGVQVLAVTHIQALAHLGTVHQL